MQYITCTWFVQCTYRSVSKTSLYILVQASSFFGSVWKQSVLSTYFVHQYCDRPTGSSIFQINQSIHNNHHAFGFTPLPLAGGAAGCGRRIGRLRVRACRAGSAGLRRSATAPASLASAAALDPAAEPKERRKDFPNRLDNPLCSNGSVVVKDVLWWSWCCNKDRR